MKSIANFNPRLAVNPEAGDLIKGDGGIRKVQVAGARVIYY
jgi:hypothetical protein